MPNDTAPDVREVIAPDELGRIAYDACYDLPGTIGVSATWDEMRKWPEEKGPWISAGEAVRDAVIAELANGASEAAKRAAEELIARTRFWMHTVTGNKAAAKAEVDATKRLLLAMVTQAERAAVPRYYMRMDDESLRRAVTAVAK